MTNPLAGLRILMLVDNPCDPDPRVTREAQALDAAGAHVTVLAWRRDSQAPEREERGQVVIRRLRPRSGRRLGTRQVWFLLGFYREVIRTLPRGPVDVVVAHDFLMLPLGAYVARRCRAHLVYDAHEIYRWMEAGRLPSPWLRAAEWVERRLIDRAVDLFVTVSEQRVDDYWHAKVSRPAVVVGNWYDWLDLEPEKMRRRYGLVGLGRPIVGYAGSLNSSRRLDLLIGLARHCPTIGVVIAGRGDPVIAEQIERAAQELSNLRYLGWVEPSTEVLAACDALYYAIDPTHAYWRFAAPNTLYTAIALDKPLVAHAGGEVAELARREGAIVVMPDLTVDALASALEAALTGGRWSGEARRLTWRLAAERYVGGVASMMGRFREAAGDNHPDRYALIEDEDILGNRRG